MSPPRSASPRTGDRLSCCPSHSDDRRSRGGFDDRFSAVENSLSLLVATARGPRTRVHPQLGRVCDMRASLEKAKRWILAELWRTSGRARSDRALLYGGARGLRILTFHETRDADLARLKQIVEWCRRRFTMATPADADALFAGKWPHPGDRILITFDDGWESNFEAAKWLASVGVSAIFFVVPSLLGRSAEEFVAFHARNRTVPSVPEASAGARGLTVGQLCAIRDMGHRIGAHNFAHRDLGRVHSLDEIRYEVDNAVNDLSELLGARCDDFAIAFGMPSNVSEEAIGYLKDLQSRGLRVYSC